jgi:hypothetical protein
MLITGCLPQNEVNVGICCHPHLFNNSRAQHLKINNLESQYPIDICSSAIKPPINCFSLGTSATSFCWKLCPLWSSSCIDLFFALLLLASMPQNDSVFLCATNPKAGCHQNNLCLRLFTYPNKATIRLIAKPTSQLLFEIHFYQAFCLIAYCQTLELLSCNKLYSC